LQSDGDGGFDNLGREAGPFAALRMTNREAGPFAALKMTGGKRVRLSSSG